MGGSGWVENVTCAGVAHGGEAVARLADGRAVFIPYAIPGERVRVRVTEVRPRFARAELVEVLEPSPDRVEPPCPHFGPGRCGGCAWQHIRPAVQAELKARLVREQLAHVGGLDAVPVRPSLRPEAPGQPEGFGYRERATLTAGADGRLGFLRAASHEVHPVDRCPLLALPLQELPGRLGRHPAGSRVRLRHGVRDERLAVLEAAKSKRAGAPPVEGLAWAAVQANGKVRDGEGPPFVTERVAGTEFHVSAASFFQVHREGADLLVELVGEALAPGPSDLLVDLYAGVGLFAATVGRRAGRVLAVESWKPAARDAERNLSGHPHARVIADDAVRGLKGLHAADLVVLDPPRAGAGAAAVRRIARLSPRAVALVSCDPAALARDVRAFVDEGYHPAWVQPVDLFPQTAHV
ncbi:MAG TPA: TRAM domain-containing protein, partial [Actinomycetes bacterium]|nr:TRAM domain-containing protein [Actinomycetes bacterium]